MRTFRTVAAITALLFVGVGCGPTVGVDAGAPHNDAGAAERDAGIWNDGGHPPAPDSGGAQSDAGVPDVGSADAGTDDSGTSATDGGMALADAGDAALDAGNVDGGTQPHDAGHDDAGQRDASDVIDTADAGEVADLCGNGDVDDGEVCDDGVNDGAYNGCATDCLAEGPRCGDTQTSDGEVCDDGVNASAPGACGAGCAGFVPLLDDIDDVQIPARLTTTVALSATDTGGAALSLDVTAPAFVSLVDNGDGTGVLNVAPEVGDIGSYSVDVRASNGLFEHARSFSLTVDAAPPDDTVCLNEFMAGSQDIIADEDGAFGDWIELYNFGLLTVDLAGWCLSDDETLTQKWCFASGSLAPGAFEVVFASDKNRQTSPRHTNFKLSRSGEYLGLYKPDGSVACAHAPTFPAQFDDISYGEGAGGTQEYFTVPTPGLANALGDGQLHRPQLYAPNQVVAATTMLSTSLLATDEDADALTILLLSGPAFVTVVDHGDGSATMTMAPSAADVGLHEVRVRASDGTLADDDTIQIEVIAHNDPLATWNDLGIFFDGRPAVADDANQRLFVSVDDHHQLPADFIQTLTFTGTNYSLGIGGAAPAASGDVVSVASVQYNDIVDVDLYDNGVFVEQYAMVLTNLPVIRLEAATVVNEPKMPGTFRLSDAWRDDDSGAWGMGIEYRGGTAQGQPKKPYAMEIRDSDGTSQNTTLVGLRDDADWQLDAAYRDQTFVRNLVSHDLYNDIHPYAYINANGNARGQGTIRGTPTEVVLNGGYAGIYILQERVDRKLLDLKKIAVVIDAGGAERWDLTDLTMPSNGSALYKAQSNNANFYHPESVANDFEQKYPDEDDVVHYGPLTDLITFVNDSDDATFLAEVANRVELDNLIDFWIVRLVSSNTDTFKKNYYVARSEAGKFFWVPWDFDATYGASWRGAALPSVSFWNPAQNQLIGRLNALPASGFNTRLKARWAALRGTTLTPVAIAARFSSYIDLMGHAVDGTEENARWRNRQRWPGSGGDGSADLSLGSVAYIEAWAADRLNWLDAQIAAQPE